MGDGIPGRPEVRPAAPPRLQHVGHVAASCAPGKADGGRIVARAADPNTVSHEMALTAVFRAMGDEMPDEFAVVYRYDWPKPDPLGT